MNPPTTEQLAEIRRYAAWAGRTWKSKLRAAWYNAAEPGYPGEYCYLQQLRNEQGPSWLNRYKLTRS